METLRPPPIAARLAAATAANDDCARVPVMRPQRQYRRMVLHSEASRRMAAALLLTLAFCGYWLCVRAATPAEIESVRTQVHVQAGTTALAAFDAANAGQPAPSLLRLHLLRLTHGSE